MPDLSDSVNWSEVDANNNNSPPNGWPEGMMPSGVNDAARADRGALKRFWNKINPVQLITPVGGVWTFTTANPAYPTAYVNGEIYCFSGTKGYVSQAGDQFRVNALPAKPIWKHVAWGPGGWSPIDVHDFPIDYVQLLYDSSLNSGSGAFVLLNPYVPIGGDGAGGVTVPGSLTVGSWVDVGGATGSGLETHGPLVANGDIAMKVPGHADKTITYLLRADQVPGNRRIGITGVDTPTTTYYPLEELWINATTTTLTGLLSAVGYHSRSGVNGPYQVNAFNIQWNGTQAHLWIDNVDTGPIVTGSAGSVVIGGNVSAGSVTASGNISGGSITSTGGMSAGGDITATGNFHQNGAYHYFAGSSGTVNATGGPLIFADANTMVLKAGNGTSGFAMQTYAGTQVFSLNNSGNMTVSGSVSAGSMTTTGAVSAGTISATGALSAASVSTTGLIQTTSTGTSIYATAGAIRSDVSGTALNLPNGNVVCQGITASGDMSVHTVTASGGITVSAGGVNIQSGGLNVVGPAGFASNITATGNLTVTGGLITLGAATTPTLVQTGNYVAVCAADSPASLQACYIVGNITDPTNYSRNGSHKFDNRSGSTTYAIFNDTPPYAYKPGGGTWGDSSDIRLKHHVEDYTSGLPEIEQLRPVRFRFNGKGGTTDDGQIYTGLIADEVRDVMPEMIGTLRARLDPEDDLEVDLLTLDATSLIYALVNSCKELAAEIAMLKEKR